MDTHLRIPLVSSTFPYKCPDQGVSEIEGAPPSSLDIAENSSSQTTSSLTLVSDPLLPSVSPGPPTSTFTLARKRKTEEPEHISRKDVRSRETLEDNICNECRQIDFDKVIRIGSKNRYTNEGVCILNVGKRFRQQSSTDCVLCQMLGASRFSGDEDTKEQREDEEDELRAFHFLSGINMIDPTATVFYDYQQKHQRQCLLVVPSSWKHEPLGLSIKRHLQDHGSSVVYPDSGSIPEIFTVQNVSARFDQSLVVKWLKYCSQNHRKLCSTGKCLVEGLKLIDCESLTVKNAHSEDSYVALSYVWGSSNENHAKIGVGSAIGNAQLPSILPAVISDAINATKLLGFRYLWIDKFCIDQNDPSKKHEQIKQMGFVYENAELAIIAAAGSDENYGLPGIGAMPRKPQLTAKIGNFRVSSSMQHPHSSIRSSKWSTRGWTFQEAMLSRRRLVFTDEQVYFECNAMNCYESVSIPFNELHVKNKSKQRSYFRAGMFGRNGKEVFGRLDLNTLSVYRVFVRYLAAIEEYSARELRYDMDSLDALIGVTRKFQGARHPYSHIWGMPYPTSVERVRASHYFANSLLWVHTQGCRVRIAKLRRRDHFPSWSWSGWSGKVTFPLHKDSGDDKLWFRSAIRSIYFEFDSKKTVEFAQMVHDPLFESAQSSFPRVLILEAVVLPPSAFSYNFEANAWTVFNKPAQLHLSQDPVNLSNFWTELKEGVKWQCIFMGDWLLHTFVMILESHNGSMYRAGIFQIEAFISQIWKDLQSDKYPVATFRIE